MRKLHALGVSIHYADHIDFPHCNGTAGHYSPNAKPCGYSDSNDRYFHRYSKLLKAISKWP